MDKYKIIDNFLNQDDLSNIQNIFFPQNEYQEKLNWYYQKGIVRDPELGPTGYEENDWMYSHSFISSGKKESDYFNLIEPILKKLNAKEILDARANLLIPTKTSIFHEYHVDRKTPHSVALFYVTSNNGYTILKDTIEVNCVKNRMLIFDGSIYHKSVTSTDDIRCVININFISNLKENFSFNYK